jgi:tetratricopeptide (TPR) repeat protein
MALHCKIFFVVLFASLGIFSIHSYGQKIDTISSDGLFQAARKAAFDNNDYPTAKLYLYKALSISPDYADIRIFLGRIYTWTKNYDSARICFNQVLSKQPDYEDATIAYVDLEYFAENYDKAQILCKTGLRNNPASELLMLREAKILYAQNKIEEANKSINKLLLLNAKNADAIALAKSFRESKEKKDAASISKTSTPSRDTTSSDGLLIAARQAAFDKNDYPLAKQYLYHALQLSPDYADIKIFLGRIHTWSKEYDSARFYFSAV